MANPFCYLELTTDQLDQARQFYGQVFDWRFEPFTGAGRPYWMVNPGQEPMGGMMERPAPQVPNAWTMYVQVDDLEATLVKLREAGGQVMMDKAPVPGHGWFAIVADPQGAVFGLWQNL